jgi:hypothetical protein
MSYQMVVDRSEARNLLDFDYWPLSLNFNGCNPPAVSTRNGVRSSYY